MKALRALLFGSTGQVGHALEQCCPPFIELLSATRQECDLADAASVRALIRRVRPDAVVNAAAYTAVDKAESERDLCYAINAAAATAIAEEAAALGVKLIHYSTDYVFDGSQAGPWTEEDATGPCNVYGASKLAGEQGIAASGAEAAVLRTSWVYSNHGGNFLKTMLRLGAERPELRIVADQHGAPTSAEAIAQATARLLERAAQGEWTSGLFHMTATGQTTWHGFAQAIFDRAPGPGPRVTAIATTDYPTPAARPRNSVLANEKFLATFGFRLPSWEDQLDAVMAARLQTIDGNWRI